ncbi:alpha/beta fold hydrolase [Fodinicola acaciae]|uniref:alpha/beta fold hydrolase n=1 Tax=Fodinicola acaciae TaxID=2681555 RepID=UPI0013D7F240|nr:alpha/beta hydrolase [Fodinicola acaciae]
MRVRTVSTDDGARLHADITGDPDGAVTVVLAHGWTLRAQSWTPVLRALRPLAHDAEVGGTRFVRYDQRCHGQSTWGTDPVTVARLGEDLFQVLRALAPTGPVVLAGMSMGGMTIMSLAGSHPEIFGDLVTGVVLVSTAAGGLAERHPRRGPIAHFVRNVPAPLVAVGQRYPRGVDRARRIFSLRHKPMLRRFERVGFGPEPAPQVVRATAAMIEATPFRTIVEFYPVLLRHDMRTQLNALARVPVSVVVGRNDQLTPVRHSREIAEAIPSATLHVEPDTGHMLLMERPHVVAAPIRKMVHATA